MKHEHTDSPLRDERVTPPMAVFRAQNDLGRDRGDLAPGVGAALRDGLVRWIAPGVNVADLTPAFAIEDPALAVAEGAPADIAPVPRFGSTLDARHLVEVPLEAGSTCHGVGMQAAPLDRSGRTYACWNMDWPAYDERNPGLYQSHPFVFVVRADGSALGVLFDTAWRSEIDLTERDAIRFRAEGPPFGVYIMHADSPARLCERIAALTGRTPMPPRWALGYHQCRWSYYPAGRAMRIAETFRDKRIPCDVIWFDIHYMQDYRIFTFHETRYPDPKSVNDRLHEMGFRTVWMIDPAPAARDDDPVHTSGLAGDHFTLASDGKPFVGSVWAGPSHFPDFTRPETRAWWADLYEDFMATGIDGVWNDMNEPSVFDDRSKTMPETCWHRGGGGLPAAPHGAYHNVYGMLMVRASRDGMLAANPERRPFVLTRSNFMGGHRYAATWTGDNAATWDDLARSIPMILSLALSGQIISGPDIGGFIDDSEGDPELFARWMAIGCLLPFARAHVAEGCVDKEPWALGAECEASCRRSIERRYRLLPHLYTLAWRAHATGAPIAAPVFFADPTDADLRAEDRAFLLGDDLLVIADVTPPGADAGPAVRLPKGDWRTVVIGEPDEHQPELRLRVGAAIATGPVMQFSDEKPVDPLTIHAALDDEGRAEGLLYEDDGDGFEFERGRHRLSRIVVETVDGEAVARLERISGDMPEIERSLRVVTVS